MFGRPAHPLPSWFFFSFCFSKQLIVFKFVESYFVLLFHVLVALLFVLGFDFIRLSPRDFQLLLFSKREILIAIWALSGSMLVSKSHALRGDVSLAGFLRWIFASICFLLALNLPRLREINSRIGTLHLLHR